MIDPWREFTMGVTAWVHPRGPGYRMGALLRGAPPETPQEALQLAGYRARSASASPELCESYGVADCGDWLVIAARGWPHAGDQWAPVRLVRRSDPSVPAWARARTWEAL